MQQRPSILLKILKTPVLCHSIYCIKEACGAALELLKSSSSFFSLSLSVRPFGFGVWKLFALC